MTPRLRARRTRTSLLRAALAFALLAVASPAAATDFRISSDTIYQSYAVRTLFATDPLEYKTRVTESLRLSVANIGWEGGLRVEASLRYDVDFGLIDECDIGGVLGPLPYSTAIVDDGANIPGSPPGSPVPATAHRRLLCGNALDIPLLYVAGERLFDGLLDFRVGRQWSTDPLGWFAFDGALVRVRLPYFFSVSLSGGVETTNGLWLARSSWERDGNNVRVDGRATSGAPPTPYYVTLDPTLRISPFVSVGIAARGFARTHAEIVYRHVWGPGLRTLESVLLPEAREGSAGEGTYAGGGLSRENVRHVAVFGATEEERIGWAVTYGFTDTLRARATVVADLMWPRFDEVTAEGQGRFLEGTLGIRAGIQFLRPRLSASSIFYYFDFRPTSEAYVRADYRAGETAWLYVRGAVREHGRTWRFGANNNNYDNSSDPAFELGPAVDAGARVVLGVLQLDVAASTAFGFGGTDAGGTVSATWTVRRRLDLLASGYLYYYENPFALDSAGSPLQAGFFGGASAGLDYTFSEGARLRVVAEDHVSPFFRSNARVYGMLNLSFWL